MIICQFTIPDFYRWYEILTENKAEFEKTRCEQLDDVTRTPVTVTINNIQVEAVLKYSFYVGDHQQLQVW